MSVGKRVEPSQSSIPSCEDLFERMAFRMYQAELEDIMAKRKGEKRVLRITQIRITPQGSQFQLMVKGVEEDKYFVGFVNANSIDEIPKRVMEYLDKKRSMKPDLYPPQTLSE